MFIEEDDPIVDEIPVMLTKSLSEHLHLIQFPVKNKSYNLDKSNILNSGYKPESQQLKIDFSLDTSSTHYDAFKGEIMGPKEDNSDAHLKKFGSRLEKVSLSSSLIEDPRYAVGIMIEKQLHLMPIKSIYQMRQNFVHLRKAEKRSNQSSKVDNDNDSEEEIDDLKQVTVKFARTGDAEKIKKAKERSYHFISQIGADEPWCETLIHPKQSNKAEIERRKIGESSLSHYGVFKSIPENEYFSQLLRDKLSFEAVENTQNEGSKEFNLLSPITLSKQQIRKLPLLDQIKVILKDAKILSFKALKEMLTDVQLTDDKILRQLVLCGMMVHGNWTLQSDILYPESFVSFRGGVSGELMSRGRDYVIYKLLRNELKLITKKRLCVITQLPVYEVQEILESISCLKIDGKTKYWDFIKSPDNEFEKHHRDIAERQSAIWKSLEEKFAEMESEKHEKRPRKKSIRDSKHF